MLSDKSFRGRRTKNPLWVQSLQDVIQDWVRREIITEDPYDDEQLAAQKLYKQFRQMQKNNQTQSNLIEF
jgi:hypothetical protein